MMTDDTTATPAAKQHDARDQLGHQLLLGVLRNRRRRRRVVSSVIIGPSRPSESAQPVRPTSLHRLADTPRRFEALYLAPRD